MFVRTRNMSKAEGCFFQSGLLIRNPANVTKLEKLNISDGCLHQTNFDI